MINHGRVDVHIFSLTIYRLLWCLMIHSQARVAAAADEQHLGEWVLFDIYLDATGYVLSLKSTEKFMLFVYIYIYIHIICWYVYDIFTCQTFIEKLVIELINLSFSTYPFIYWRRACCLNHNFKSQYLLENLGLFYTKHLILPGSTRPSVTHGTRASGLYLKRKAGGDPPKIGWIRGMEKPTGPWDAKDDI